MTEKFVIQPHFRLQEWVAEEKGYFRDEGLEYTFHEEVQKSAGQVHDKGAKVGAYQSLEAGRASDVSCACHWTVNVAAAAGHVLLQHTDGLAQLSAATLERGSLAAEIVGFL